MKPQQSIVYQNWFKPLSIAVVGVAFLSACSSSSTTTADQPSDDDDEIATMFPIDVDGDDRPGLIVTGLNGMDPEDVVSPWLLNTYMFRLDSRTPGTGDGRVDLLRYSDDFSVARHIEFFEEELGFCDIDDPDVPQPIGGGGGNGNGPPPLISGGSTVVINTPSGPWFTYVAEVLDNGDVQYLTDNGLPTALPPGATVSVPGDAFPTVEAYPVYEPAVPVRLLPDVDDPITGASEFSWIPGDTPAWIKINLLAYNANNEFEGFYVNCYVQDTGSFSMPDAVVDYVDTTQYRLVSRYSRVFQRLDVVNGIVHRQFIEVGE